jgi:biopolymer transport protein ExbD
MTAQASASPRRTNPVLQRRRHRARISLTPLIDVVFILLVFFMLASTFLDERAIKVDAPAASLGGTSMEGALLIDLRPDGLRLGGQRLTGAQLLARLAEHAARNPAQRVLIKPAPGVSLQDAVALLDRVMASGLTQVSFLRDPAR